MIIKWNTPIPPRGDLPLLVAQDAIMVGESASDRSDRYELLERSFPNGAAYHISCDLSRANEQRKLPIFKYSVYRNGCYFDVSVTTILQLVDTLADLLY